MPHRLREKNLREKRETPRVHQVAANQSDKDMPPQETLQEKNLRKK